MVRSSVSRPPMCRVVARHDHHGVRPRGGAGHRVLAALDDLQPEDGPGPLLAAVTFGNLQPARGDTDVAARPQVPEEVSVGVRFERERLLDHPAPGLLRRRADEAVLGHGQIAAGGRAQGEHTAAPVGQGQIGGGAADGQRRQIGTARRMRRVERARCLRRTLVLRRRVRHPHPTGRRAQPYGVQAVREHHPVRAEPLGQRLARRTSVDQAAAVPVQLALVGERTDDREGADGVLGERQQTVIGEENDGLFRGLQGERPMGGGVEGTVEFLWSPAGLVELAQRTPHPQQPPHRRVHRGRVDQPARQRAPHPRDRLRRVLVVVGEAVHPRPQGRRDGLLMGVEVVLGVDQIGWRARVGADHQLLVGPGAQVFAQIWGDVVGPPVDQVVRGHHPGHGTRPHGPAEGRQIVFVQHPWPYRGGGGVPVGLVVVRQPVLEDGRGAPKLRVVAAQSAGVGRGQGRGEVRILGVPLLVAAPARIAQRIHRRRPHIETHPRIACAHGPCLAADRLADAPHQLRVPGRAEPDGLGEDGRRAHPGDAVERLLPGAEGREAEPLHPGRVLVEHRDPLIRREPGQQILDAGTHRQPWIAEGRIAEGRTRDQITVIAHGYGPFSPARAPTSPAPDVESTRFDVDSKRFDAGRTMPTLSRLHGSTTQRHLAPPLLRDPTPRLNLSAISKRFDQSSINLGQFDHRSYGGHATKG